MYTQCPHCLTLFRISNDELKIASGKAKCCQCNEVFNALGNLRESPTLYNIPATIGLDADDSLFAESLNLDSQQLNEIEESEQDSSIVSPDSQDDIDMLMAVDDGLETEPEYFASSSESQMSELLDGDSTPSSQSFRVDDSLAKVVPFNPQVERQAPESADDDQLEAQSIPQADTEDEDKPRFHFTELQKVEASPSEDYELDEVFEKQRIPLSNIAWGLGSLILVLAILLQLAWQYREWTIQHEWGRQLLSQVCAVVGCTPPVRRDISQIRVRYRDLRSHPENPDALLLQLNMVNQAEFAQPFPKLELILLNDQDKPVVNRIFEPSEYLSEPPSKDELMERSIPVFISLELKDPGKSVTGFKFEFL